MRKTITAILLALCAAIAAPNLAEADTPDPPAFCDSAREDALFDLGVRKGRNLAAQAIRRALDPADQCGDPDAIDDLRALIQAIVDAIDIPTPATEPVRCHVAGQVEGLLDKIQALQDDCLDLCIADGEFIGQIAGFLYCELSIALGGLVPVELFIRLATDACGVNFQVACDNAFEETTTDDPLCLPFTEDEHTEVFREVQNNQCADNPEPPP